jgi:hypothetical protein
MGDCCGLVDVDLVVELLAQASSTFQHSHQVGSPRELRKTTCSSWGCQVIGLHYTQLHNSPQGCISSQDVGGQERPALPYPHRARYSHAIAAPTQDGMPNEPAQTSLFRGLERLDLALPVA